MFKLGYHTRGAVLQGPHLLMTRLAAKQSHYCGLFSRQPTSQTQKQRKRDGDTSWLKGAGESRAGKEGRNGGEDSYRGIFTDTTPATY